MPVYSMTGYACLQSSYSPSQTDEKSTPLPETCNWQLTLELRSVNSRFLDLALKLPEELRPFEAALRDMVQKTLRRGKVELRAQLSATSGHTHQPAAPSPATLQKLIALQDSVLAWMPQSRPLAVAEILQLVASPRPSLPESTLRQWLLQEAQKLLGSLQQARQTEGAQLARSLQTRIEQLRELSQRATPLIPQLVTQQRQRFLDKWQEALQIGGAAAGGKAGGTVTAETAADRALAEATAFALHIDVAEELVRLQAHLDTIETLLKQGGELGKRLDFIIQELHREANTLGSKSATLETSHISVDMKVLIEQMREQVQNIE